MDSKNRPPTRKKYEVSHTSSFGNENIFKEPKNNHKKRPLSNSKVPTSLIPKPVNDIRKRIPLKQTKSPSLSRLPTIKSISCDVDYNKKLKVLEEKEKSISDYYNKIQALFNQSSFESCDPVSVKTQNVVKNSSAKKMWSDPSVFKKSQVKLDAFADFKSRVREISNIWLKTSNNLSKSINELKNTSSLDSKEFESHKVQIEMAIKRARSLTLIKTRGVIAEARKLIINQKMIRQQIESIIKTDNDNLKGEKNGEFQKGIKLEREKTLTYTTKSFSFKESENQNSSNLASVYTDGRKIDMFPEELAKRNKKISDLNHKVFELQNECNDFSIKCNQLELELFKEQEKNKWNDLMWKQIFKLKSRIKNLQDSNKELDIQKTELVRKIQILEPELMRVRGIDGFEKQNCVTNIQNYFRDTLSCDGSYSSLNQKLLDDAEQKILMEKQKAINQLKGFLDQMKNQETHALKNIAAFEAEIAKLKTYEGT